MGYLLHIISTIIFFFLSFYFTHIFISKSSFNAEKYFNNFVPSQKELYFNVDEEKGTRSQGLEALILGKFRLLIEFESFTSKKSRNGHYGHLSPSGAPSPSPLHSPAPAPMLHFHRHAPPPRQKLYSFPPVHKGKGDKKVLIAILGSVGALTLILCAIGVLFGYRKFKQKKRKPKRNLFTYRTESNRKGKSRFLSSQTSVKKVTSAPGPDLFYLNSLESALEPEKCCVKLNYDTGKAYINNIQSVSYSGCDERQESDEKIISEESGSVGCSSIGEITPVHEIHNSSVNERVNAERIQKFGVPDEVNSSDDESFHSFCDSRSSSQRRLSNASETIQEYISTESNAKTTPPPPPPPPPPLPTPYSGVKLKSCLKSSLALPSTSYSPKSPVGIPPPPCPPMPKLQVSSPKVPSPPLHFSQQMPLGKDGCPLPKLKALHWDKVRAAPNRSTVWDKLRSSSFEFDEEMMESLFGYNMQNNMKSDEVKSKTPSPTKHVLEPKRLQNITILSKALNMTPEQVCGALIRGDGLLLQDLETLSKMVLTKDEETKLLNYKGDIHELGSAEVLVKLLLKIPFAFARIEALLYRESFDDEVIHLRKSFSMLEEACKELRSSRLFLKLLEAVLKTGNRMNVGTIRGEAKAFKLDTLLKLADVKGTDGKTTLLHFVVQEIIRSEGIRVSESIMGKINQKSSTSNVVEDKEEYYQRMGLELVTGLTTELCNVKKTATIDSDVLASSVTNLSNGMRKFQNLIEEEMINEENKGNFVNSMRSFFQYADMMLRELKEEENRVILHVREVTEYFHGNVSKNESNPLRIFVIVRDFLSMLDHVCKELKSSKGQRNGNNPLAPFR